MYIYLTNNHHVYINDDGVVKDFFENELEFNVKESLNENSIALFNISTVDEIKTRNNLLYISNQVKFSNENIYLIDKLGKKLDISDPNEIIVEKDFSLDYLYDVFEYLVMQFLPEKSNSMLIHASGMKFNDKTFIFTGCNNTGKTKVMLEFAKDGALIFGDDWVIFDRDSKINIYSRAIRMYQNDIVSSPDLVDNSIINGKFLYNSFSPDKSFLKRSLKKVYGFYLHRRKMIPYKLKFSDLSEHAKYSEIEDRQKVDIIFLYSKSTSNKISHENIDDKTKSADRIYYAILNEDQKVQDFSFWYNFAIPNGFKKNYSSRKDILRQGFDKTKVVWLKVPFDADFKDVKEYVEENFL